MDLARRQIIRGMAAVPVVMTVSNASAQATESSLRCIGNAGLDPQPPCLPATTPPTRDLGGVPGYGDLAGYFDNGDGSPVYNGLGPDGQYCPVYVDSGGTVTNNPGDSPVTASCLNSFT